MRVFGHILTVTCLCGVTYLGAQTPPAQTPPAPAASATPDASAKVLADARKALGGDSKLNAIKTFVATGRTRRLSGDNLVPVEFEIDVELPDKYVRKDEVPAQETAPSSNGFNGDALIQIPPPAPPPATPPAAAARAAGPPPSQTPAGPAPAGDAARGAAAGPGAAAPTGGRAAGPPMTPEQQQAAQRMARVNTVKQDFARLTLAMFATSFSSYPLTFSYVGQAEAPQGKADVIDAKGAGNFTLRLFLNSESHLPIMVSWSVPVTPANIILVPAGQSKPANAAPGSIVVSAPAPPPAGASKDEQDKYAKDVAALRQKAMADTKTIENRLYFSDYRDNDGVQFPFKLRRAVGADTIEETTFDHFKLNAKIDPKRFETVK
jgi:hypothetical protein